MEEGCSSRNEFDGRSLQSIENTSTCFVSNLSPRVECTSSFHGHEIKHIGYFLDDQTNVKFLENHV